MIYFTYFTVEMYILTESSFSTHLIRKNIRLIQSIVVVEIFLDTMILVTNILDILLNDFDITYPNTNTYTVA